MELLPNLEADLVEALKNQDTNRVSVLRLLKSAIKNAEIENNKPLEESEIIAVLGKQAKQRKDSIEQFNKANRQDLVEKEASELKIIESYLPKKLSKEELLVIIADTITQTGASSMKDMGLVIGEVIAKTKGRADGKMVSDIVKERLA